MGIKDLSEDAILSDLARSMMDEIPERGAYEDGWRTIRELVEETGKTEAVVRAFVDKKLSKGECELIKSHPYTYRVKR